MTVTGILPTVERISNVFTYDRETGFLWFVAPSQGRDMAKPAGSISKVDGFRRVMIDGRLYHSERIIWKLMTGEDPADILHINGNRSDNRWCNLKRVRHDAGRNEVAQ